MGQNPKGLTSTKIWVDCLAKEDTGLMKTKHCPKLNCRCYRNKHKLNCRCYRIIATAKGKHQPTRRRRSQRLPRRQWHPQHTKQQQVEEQWRLLHPQHTQQQHTVRPEEGRGTHSRRREVCGSEGQSRRGLWHTWERSTQQRERSAACTYSNRERGSGTLEQ